MIRAEPMMKVLTPGWEKYVTIHCATSPQLKADLILKERFHGVRPLSWPALPAMPAVF